MKTCHSRLLACGAVVLGACASAPSEHFYQLTPVALHAAAQTNALAPTSSTAPLRIAIAATVIPDILDREQMVFRAGANRVLIEEQQRWAEPLRAAFSRVLAADLAAALPEAVVWPDAQPIQSEPDYRIAIDVVRVDAVAGADVEMQILWTIRPLGLRAQNETVRSASRTYHAPASAGGGAGLSAGLSTAIGDLSQDLAHQLALASVHP